MDAQEFERVARTQQPDHRRKRLVEVQRRTAEIPEAHDCAEDHDRDERNRD
jgi:hypothetical protein